MAFKRAKARVAERSTTAGSGPWTLAGALDTSYQTFASFLSNGDTIEVTVVEPGVAVWTGIATFASAGPTITATTVEETYGTFGAGTKEIFASALASRSLLREDLSGLTTGGTSTAYTVTTKTAWATLAKLDGNILAIKAHATSGATPTLAVDGLTAKNLRLQSGVTCPTGAFIGGSTYLVRYDNSNNEFVALNIPNKIVPDAVITSAIIDDAVTYAKMQNVTAARLLGNPTGGSTDPSEISLVSTDLAFSGSTLKLNTSSITIQTFTSGSGTYTTPAGVKWLEVRLVGGGGGGGGGQNSSAATSGGSSTFSTFTAGGGSGGAFGAAGTGGSASGGNVGNYVGGAGGPPTPPAAAYNAWGGQGGDSFFGGGGAGVASNGTGGAGGTNTGGGGGGGGATNGTLTGSGGAGGGAGGTVIAVITSPAATYSYGVGAGGAGAAGSGSGSSAGGAGGAGAAGRIEVIEHYAN